MMKKLLALALVLTMGLTMSACAPQERYPEIADLLDKGAYEDAMLAIYELYLQNNPTAPTEDPILERKYNTLITALDALTPYVQNHYDLSSFSFVYFNGYEHIQYEGMNAVAWLYQTAAELGIYEDAAEIASRFTVLENMPLEKTYRYADALGNSIESSRVYYVYGAEGELLSECLDMGAISDHFPYNYGKPEYTYDANGRIETLRYLSGGTVNCVISYTYNSNGTTATEHYRDRAGNEYTIKHRYKSGILISSSGVPYAEGSKETMTVSYSYDDNGRLILESGINDHWNSSSASQFIKTIRYTYDEGGRVTTIRKATEYHIKAHYKDKDRVLEQYQDVREWTFSYDADGRMIRNTYAVIGTTAPDGTPYNSSYRIYTGDIRYGNYYVYTPVA